MAAKNVGKRGGDQMLKKKKFKFIIKEQTTKPPEQIEPEPDVPWEDMTPEEREAPPTDIVEPAKPAVSSQGIEQTHKRQEVEAQVLQSLDPDKDYPSVEIDQLVDLAMPPEKEIKNVILAGNSHMAGYSRALKSHLQKSDPNVEYRFFKISKPQGQGGELRTQLKFLNNLLGGELKGQNIHAIVHGGSSTEGKWMSRLEQLLTKYRELTPNISFIGSPSPREDFADPESRRKRNEEIATYLKEQGISYYDVFGTTLKTADYAKGRHGEIHPNTGGYKKAYQTIRDSLYGQISPPLPTEQIISDQEMEKEIPSIGFGVKDILDPDTGLHNLDWESPQELQDLISDSDKEWLIRHLQKPKYKNNPQAKWMLKTLSHIHLFRLPKSISKYDRLFNEAAKQESIDTMPLTSRMLKAIASAESSFNPNAVSYAGAAGIMQLMVPGAAGRSGGLTASEDSIVCIRNCGPDDNPRQRKYGKNPEFAGVDERFDPTKAIPAAARLLNWNYKQVLKGLKAKGQENISDKHKLMIAFLSYRDGQRGVFKNRNLWYHNYIENNDFEGLFNEIITTGRDNYLKRILIRSGVNRMT